MTVINELTDSISCFNAIYDLIIRLKSVCKKNNHQEVRSALHCILIAIEETEHYEKLRQQHNKNNVEMEYHIAQLWQQMAEKVQALLENTPEPENYILYRQLLHTCEIKHQGWLNREQIHEFEVYTRHSAPLLLIFSIKKTPEIHALKYL